MGRQDRFWGWRFGWVRRSTSRSKTPDGDCDGPASRFGPTDRPPPSSRQSRTGEPINWRRVALLVSSGLIIVFVVVEIRVGLESNGWGNALGLDYGIYMEAVHRWLSGGGFYLDRQLHGPYEIAIGDVLYPPTAIWFLLPFAFLPWPIWWIGSLGLLIWLVWTWRPAFWSLPLLVACIAFPPSVLDVMAGNPGLWIAGFVGLGLRFGWPGALVLLKPSVFPFALAGISTRGWWLTVASLAVLTLPLLPMAPDWIHTVLDGRGFGGWLYSVKDVGLLLLPVIAWKARRNA